MLASHRVKDCGSGAGVVLCEELPARGGIRGRRKNGVKKIKQVQSLGGEPSTKIQQVIRDQGNGLVCGKRLRPAGDDSESRCPLPVGTGARL